MLSLRVNFCHDARYMCQTDLWTGPDPEWTVEGLIAACMSQVNEAEETNKSSGMGSFYCGMLGQLTIALLHWLGPA